MASFRRKGISALLAGLAEGAEKGIPAAVNLYSNSQVAKSNMMLSLTNMMNVQQQAYQTQMTNWLVQNAQHPELEIPQPVEPPILRLFGGGSTTQSPTRAYPSDTANPNSASDSDSIYKTGTPGYKLPENVTGIKPPTPSTAPIDPKIQLRMTEYEHYPKGVQKDMAPAYATLKQYGRTAITQFDEAKKIYAKDISLTPDQLKEIPEIGNGAQALVDIANLVYEGQQKGINLTGLFKHKGFGLPTQQLIGRDIALPGTVDIGEQAFPKEGEEGPLTGAARMFPGVSKPTDLESKFGEQYNLSKTNLSTALAKGNRDQASANLNKAEEYLGNPNKPFTQYIQQLQNGLFTYYRDNKNYLDQVGQTKRLDGLEKQLDILKDHPLFPKDRLKELKTEDSNLPGDQIDYTNQEEVMSAVQSGRVPENYAIQRVQEAMSAQPSPEITSPSVPPSTKGTGNMEPLNKTIQNMIAAGAVIPDGMPEYEKNAENIPPDEYASYQQSITNAPIGSIPAPAPSMAEQPIIDPMQRAQELRELLGLPRR